MRTISPSDTATAELAEPTVVIKARPRIEADVLRAFRRGDEAAMRALYRTYRPLVYAVAHRVLGQRDLAEEAAQQAFVRAWQAADRLDVDRDPAPWLSTIAKRAAIDIYRREARRAASSLTDVPAHDPALVSLPPDLQAVDEVWQVRRAIAALPTDEATVVRLQHLDGLSQTEIASRLDVAVGTVKSRSHRAHRRLASSLSHLRNATVAVVAVLLLALGAFAVAQGRSTTDYAVQLAATPLAPGASASAGIVRNEAGFRIDLDATGLPPLTVGEYYQAWLKGPTGTTVPIGTFSSSDGAVTLWSGVSPADYPMLTITVEATDNNQSSSGRMVLAGPIIASP